MDRDERGVWPPHLVRPVEQVGSRGFAVLDVGPAMAGGSLRLSGGTLRWRDSGPAPDRSVLS